MRVPTSTKPLPRLGRIARRGLSLCVVLAVRTASAAPAPGKAEAPPAKGSPAAAEPTAAEGSRCGERPLCVIIESPSEAREPAMVLSDVPEGESEQVTPVLELGGALRFSAFYKSWERTGTVISGRDDVAFDTFFVDVESYYSGLHLSAQYRFYAGFSMLQHGYLAFERPRVVEASVGVVRAPFGILPYAAHNWFLGLGYYVGLEDDHDLGARTDFRVGNLDLQFAYFRNDEGSYTGRSEDSARYSYDVVHTRDGEVPGAGAATRNEEKNQGNVRLAQGFEHRRGRTEIGVSGQLGGIYNADVNRFGLHWAAAGHLAGRYGPWDLQLQYAHYTYDLQNPPGQPDDVVMMGAYDAPYRVASEGGVLTTNLAYVLEVGRWLIETVTFYNDYSWLHKPKPGFADSHQNVTGLHIHWGPIHTFFDCVVGKNDAWISGDYPDAFAEGNAGPAWHTRVNANFGYYF